MSIFDNEPDANAQGQGDQPTDVFSDGFQMMEEDGGLIQPSNLFENQSFSEEQNQQPPAAPVIGGVGDPNPQGTPAPEPKVKFEDELVDKYSKKPNDGELSNEELIQKLQERGYSAPEKVEEKSEDFVENQELQRLNNELQNAENFLSKSDDEVVLLKSRDDIAKKYTSLGKAHLIGTEDFDIDVEAQVDEISVSETQKKLFADNVRNGIENYKGTIEQQKSILNTKRQEKKDQAIAQNRLKLQGSIENIVSGGKFLGIDVNAEQAQAIYGEITSGEFTKTINSNPDLVAKFAFFIKNQEAIESAFGGATYGQGVKDAVSAIRDKGSQTSKSPISQAINSSNAQGGTNRLASWKLPVIEEDKNKPEEQRYVAGRV